MWKNGSDAFQPSPKGFGLACQRALCCGIAKSRKHQIIHVQIISASIQFPNQSLTLVALGNFLGDKSLLLFLQKNPIKYITITLCKMRNIITKTLLFFNFLAENMMKIIGKLRFYFLSGKPTCRTPKIRLNYHWKGWGFASLYGTVHDKSCLFGNAIKPIQIPAR